MGLSVVRIFLPIKWAQKVIDANRINDRMIAIKVFVQGIAVIAVWALCVSRDSQKDHFYNTLINIVRTLGKKEIVAIARVSNCHFESNAEDYGDQNEGYGCRVTLRKSERIL